jgi:hypothetical protein
MKKLSVIAGSGFCMVRSAKLMQIQLKFNASLLLQPTGAVQSLMTDYKL